MAKRTPMVHGDILVDPQQDQDQVLPVGSPAWFAWLATASSFAFRGESGTFTARKERAGNRRGGWYWKAYRTQQGRRSSAYLGPSDALTLERLTAAARTLGPADGRETDRDPRTGSVAPAPSHPLDAALLTTKLHVPRLPQRLVQRPHLMARLQPALQCPFTLLAAPAGCGKTTLLAAWLHEAPVASAWVSLDAGDDDPIRFWTYTLAALDTVYAEGRFSALGRPLLQSPQPPPLEILLTAVLNRLTALPVDVVLVLDDYHVITAAPIHAALAFVLEHLPVRIHLVLATRADPPLPLARLRARGQMVELRAADLCFSRAEAATFLEQAGAPALSADELAVLEAQTEGWIAGVQLAALALQGQPDRASFLQAFSGTHRFVADFLTQEVLARQPEDVQDFLLQTAILERLCGPLCEAVTGAPAGQRMLEGLEEDNLFVLPLDAERRWYRYHHLFAEMLRQRLQRLHPERVAALHRRASAWYAQHDLIHDAVHHALAAGDDAQAGCLIEGAAERLTKRGEIATLRAWLARLPTAVVRTRVELSLRHSWLLAQDGQFAAAEGLLETIESPGRVDNDIGAANDVAGRVAAIRALIAFRQGDARRTIVLGRRARAQLPADAAARGLLAWMLGIAYLLSGDPVAGAAALEEAQASGQTAGNSYAAVMATFELAHLQADQGQLHRADQSYRQALERAAGPGERLAATGPAYVGRGDLQREWNNVDRAARYLQEGIAGCQQTGNGVIVLLGTIALARVHQMRGDAASVQALIQTLGQALQTQQFLPHNAMQLAAWQARLALQQGDLDMAARWAQARGLRVEDEPHLPLEIERLTWARVLLAQQRPVEAAAVLSRLQRVLERHGWTGKVLEVLILQALAQQARGDEAGALEPLARALSLAEPEGYIRLFVDEGPALARLLAQLRLQQPVVSPAMRRYRDHLLILLGSAPDMEVAAPRIGRPLLVEALSTRELEILRLIAAGCSNRDIADRLVLALSTVKWYVNTLYGKLGVARRTQAVARARDLHLV